MQVSTVSAGQRSEYGQSNTMRVLLKPPLFLNFSFLFFDKALRVNTELWILHIILEKWIPKAWLPSLIQKGYAFSTLLQWMSAETTICFIVFILLNCLNCHFFCDFQDMILWGYREWQSHQRLCCCYHYF